MESGTNVIQLTDVQLAGFAKKCIDQYRESERKHREAQRQEIYQKRFKWTKLLLKAYPALKAHAEDGVSDSVQLYGSPYELLEKMMQGHDLDEGHEEYQIESIMESRRETATMLLHIERELDVFKANCLESGKDNIYTTIEDLYLLVPTLTIRQTASELSVDESTVRYYRDQGIQLFMIYLFGVDGLNTNDARCNTPTE